MPFKLWFPYWVILAVIILGGLVILSDSWWNINSDWVASGGEDSSTLLIKGLGKGSAVKATSGEGLLGWSPQNYPSNFKSGWNWV